MKLLGSTDKHFIFSDLRNSKTVFIKAEGLDTLTFQEKNKQLRKRGMVQDLLY
jgi:hypothetical protein